LQVSQGGLVLVVGGISRLAGIVAGFAVGLVGSLAGGRSYLSGIGRCASIECGCGGQYRNGQVSLERALDHRSADNLADYPIASIRAYSGVVGDVGATLGAGADSEFEVGAGDVIDCPVDAPSDAAVIAGVELAASFGGVSVVTRANC
jgi:hypothetical protein